uniref:Mitochondrial Carrier (MC) Family putative n=1 Tax=Albugo laibachii Nc14 TaxID=890382 RepID=F0WPD9_9STRA|nr:Mitochondrial Carrier (MC) Family putative [Albugo laibachii Nc14]|eukprot:CCA23186.1 Mitochondrial Carrier (MC) Family putative [Albugo laibachii Nc14]
MLKQTLRKTIQSVHAEEGIRAFWRGNLSATALWISYSAIQFACYQNMDQFWSAEILQNHPTSVHTVNGAFSGVFAAILTYPLDLFRTIFAAQGVPRRYPTISSLAHSLLQRKGVSGLFQGMGPSLLQIAPYMGLSFGIYSSLDRLSNSQSKETRVLTKWRLFSYLGNGAVSGLISKLAVYPIDTIKKRMQMQSVQCTPMYGTIQKYSSSWHCMRTIFHYEGLYGFYKGVTPSIAKSVVTQSSTFACYELGIHIIKYIESR